MRKPGYFWLQGPDGRLIVVELTCEEGYSSNFVWYCGVDDPDTVDTLPEGWVLLERVTRTLES